MKTIGEWEAKNHSPAIIKAVVGIRGLGKRELLLNHLPSNTLCLDFDDPKLRRLMTADDVLDYLKAIDAGGEMRCLVLCEIWRIWKYADLIRALKAQGIWNIFVVTSNARPFQFEPIVDEGEPLAVYEIWAQENDSRSPQMLGYAFDSLLVRDIADGFDTVDVRRIQALAQFYSDNLGDIVSDRQVAQKLVVDGERRSAPLIGIFRKALVYSYLVEFCECYDIFEKGIVKNNARVFFTDLAMREYRFGAAPTDEAQRLKYNQLYLKLRKSHKWVYWLRGSETALKFVTVDKHGEERVWES